MNGISELTDSGAEEKKTLDVTFPAKFPFKTDRIERKLIDLSKEKNVKTHSKIIIEFSGKTKRERSAIDSFTKLEKDGRLTKKTLVSNTKEISIPAKTTKDKPEESDTNAYPLSSTPRQTQRSPSSPTSTPEQSNQLINRDALYLVRKESPTDQETCWKEASHSEITNELSADPLLDENNQAHPTKSVSLTTTTTFDRTALGQPQRIDHSNKYQRCFENPLIHEPLIESNLTMLDEPSGQETASTLSSAHSSSSEHLAEEQVNISKFRGEQAPGSAANNLTRPTAVSGLARTSEPKSEARMRSRIESRPLESRALESRAEQRPPVERKSESSSEPRSADSRLSNSSQSRESGDSKVVRGEDPELNANSRSASRVSFNLPENYRDTDEESSQQFNQQPTTSHYSAESTESAPTDRHQRETNLDDLRPTVPRASKSTSQTPAGLLETELDDRLFYEEDYGQDDYPHMPDDQSGMQSEMQPTMHSTMQPTYYDRQYIEHHEQTRAEPAGDAQVPQTSREPSKSKERKSKTSKRKHTSSTRQSAEQPASDQSLISTAGTQPRASPKHLNDSGFLSPEIYHSSPYELAYKQVNRDEPDERTKEKKPRSEKKKSSSTSSKKSSDKEKRSKHSKSSLLKPNGLQFTEHSSNTEIITRLTKTSYPSNFADDAALDGPRLIEKSLKQLKRNKMVLDQILTSPEIKGSSKSKSESKKSSRSGEKKKKSGCKISSQVTMDLPVYKEARSKSGPAKSVSLEELEKERDLDRKSLVSQHSNSQKSGEFNTMTKFQRHKPSAKLSKKNKSALQLNQTQPDETNWEYTMQCNCVNGSKANVL